MLANARSKQVTIGIDPFLYDYCSSVQPTQTQSERLRPLAASHDVALDRPNYQYRTTVTRLVRRLLQGEPCFEQMMIGRTSELDNPRGQKKFEDAREARMVHRRYFPTSIE